MKIRYFTANDILLHNTPDDCWVSFLGRVYDLTLLLIRNKGSILLNPILAAAGSDISHWFNDKTGDVRYHVDSITHCYVPYVPFGQFINIPPPYPTSNWATDFGIPWWKDDQYLIGFLTIRARVIEIVNTLALTEHKVEVCNEETLTDILVRCLKYNAHAASYTWKYHGKVLDMNTNLENNGVKEEVQEIEDNFMPKLYLYFNDDLTEA